MRGATRAGRQGDVGMTFQSTLPMRGATRRSRASGKQDIISIHAPHAGSDQGHHCHKRDGGNFNPRSPCGERPPRSTSSSGSATFQSTLPMRGATRLHYPASRLQRISIHAPHAGSDADGYVWLSVQLKFQSTLPMRGATLSAGHRHAGCQFQSTLPMRGATRRGVAKSGTASISIHAPHAGSDAS